MSSGLTSVSSYLRPIVWAASRPCGFLQTRQAASASTFARASVQSRLRILFFIGFVALSGLRMVSFVRASSGLLVERVERASRGLLVFSGVLALSGVRVWSGVRVSSGFACEESAFFVFRGVRVCSGFVPRERGFFAFSGVVRLSRSSLTSQPSHPRGHLKEDDEILTP